MTRISEYLWVAALTAQIGWAGRLWGLGVVRRYPVLFSFLIFNVLQALLGLVLYDLYLEGSGRFLYRRYWVVLRFTSWTLYLCIVLEIYRRMFSGYGGFQRLGQLVLYGGLGAASIVVVGTIFLDPSADLATMTGFWILQERSVYVGLTGLCLLLVLFAAYFHLTLPRNVRVLIVVFGLVFAGQALLWSFRNYFGDGFRSVRDVGGPLLYIACVSAGALTFSKAGEEHPLAAQSTLDQDTERLMIQKLQSFNKALSRVLQS